MTDNENPAGAGVVAPPDNHTTTAPAGRTRSARGQLAGLVAAARPRQWARNALLAAAPLAAGQMWRRDIAYVVLVDIAAFCVVAAGTYLVNDARDAPLDREHAVKRHRPVASGATSPRVATVAGGALLVAGVVFAAVLGGTALARAAGAYIVLTLCYTLYLKHWPTVEMLVIASTYLLRALTGAVTTGVGLSPWFLVVTSVGAVHVVAGKRLGEVIRVGEARSATRPVLDHYRGAYLRLVCAASAAASVAAYALWAAQGARHGLWAGLSVAPFALAVLRYATLARRGLTDDPERVFGRDRPIRLLVLGWLAVMVPVVAR